MEPIFLKAIYKHNVWGGYNISEKLKNIPKIQIGESWEVSANQNGDTVILNKEYEGKTLSKLFQEKENRVKIFGTKTKDLDRFPLLVKYIDANENLSVQVHPNDFYAKKLENGVGKTELWHILDCKKDAKIICGLKEDITTKEEFSNLTENEIINHLKYLSINKGDTICIKAGTIHAIMKNTLLCEIQQNSDITYRVYDWNRNDENRPLHLKQAKEVVDIKSRGETVKDKECKNKIYNLCHNEYFYVDKVKIDGKFFYSSNKDSFQILNIVKGNGILKKNQKEYELKLGESILIPAMLGEYEIEGNIDILISYI